MPSNLKQLRQRAADLNGEILSAKKARASVGDAAVKENRALSAEERAAFVAGGQTITDLEAKLAENGELLQAAESLNEAERAYQPGPDPDALAGQKAAAAAGVQTGRVEVTDKTKEPGFFGRCLQAVRGFAVNGRVSATEADLLKMMAGPSGLNTDVPSEGGFLVAPERSSVILQRAYQIGQVLSRVNRMPIGPNSNGMQIPAIDETSRANNSRFGGIVSGWLGQGNAAASVGKPKFRIMDLKLRKVGAFCYATDEQIADSIALEAWINRFLPLELTYRTEDAVFNGTGAGQPLGLLNSGALITVTRNTAAHVTSLDLQGMWNRLWAPLRGNAVWFVDQSVEADLDALGIAIGTGGIADPSYKPAGSVPGQPYATYKGAPIIPVEYGAAIGTTGDIVLTNLDEYVLIDKGGVQSAVSMHVAFLTDEAVYRFIYRVDGQNSWSSVLTPKSGGSTLSDVVVLS